MGINIDSILAYFMKDKGSQIIIYFFLISKNYICTNGYFVHEKHIANPENTRRKNKEKTRKNQTTKKITKEKENKEKKGENH